ncbi:MAG: hypothetical protein A3G93_11215 [Nitrospinae bacterium RIFCSPLOWO2_12_FULL_45_22]|nr:MAG: hypothetical protein A3G93_11215 [Nitrospinae bacterium RIFCSPLOWO2_12_FULL_45_22]
MNPGYLKVKLALEGVRLGASLQADDIEKQIIHRIEGDYQGVMMILPEDIWAYVPIVDHPEPHLYTLVRERDTFFIQRDEERIPIRLVHYHKTNCKNPCPNQDIQSLKTGFIHGKFISFSPLSCCPSLGWRTYCPHQGQHHTISGKHLALEAVLEDIQKAVDNDWGEFVHLHVGLVATEDRGITLLEPYITAIKRRFNTLIAVEIDPPTTNDWIDRTYALGVDSISYNIDIFNPPLFQKIHPEREALIGRERYLEALAYAAEIFPAGTVTSQLILGLEPKEWTLTGIDTLTKLRIVPLLPLPLLGTWARKEIARGDLLSLEDIIEIGAHLYWAVKKNRVRVNWMNFGGHILTPLDGRFFAAEKARLQVALHNIYTSKLGGKVQVGFSNLRRRLRVKRVMESLDSSGL